MKTKTLILGFALLVPSFACAAPTKHLSGVGSSLISEKAHALCASSVGMRADEVEAFCCNLNGSCSSNNRDLASLECTELDGLCAAAQTISDGADEALSSLEDYVSTQISKYESAVEQLNKKIAELSLKKNKNSKAKQQIIKLKKTLRLAKRTALRIHGEGSVILSQSQSVRTFSKNQMNHVCELPTRCDPSNDPAVDPTPAPQDSPGDPMPPVFEPAPQDPPGDMMPPVFAPDPGAQPSPTPAQSGKGGPILPVPADPLNPDGSADTGSGDSTPPLSPPCMARGDQVFCL